VTARGWLSAPTSMSWATCGGTSDIDDNSMQIQKRRQLAQLYFSIWRSAYMKDLVSSGLTMGFDLFGTPLFTIVKPLSR